MEYLGNENAPVNNTLTRFYGLPSLDKKVAFTVSYTMAVNDALQRYASGGDVSNDARTADAGFIVDSLKKMLDEIYSLSGGEQAFIDQYPEEAKKLKPAVRAVNRSRHILALRMGLAKPLPSVTQESLEVLSPVTAASTRKKATITVPREEKKKIKTKTLLTAGLGLTAAYLAFKGQ